MIQNLLLFLSLVLFSPKFLIDRWKGKRHPDFLQRLGFHLPKPEKPVIWMHAVSVGEVKALQPLFEALKSPNSYFFITTTTATGQQEARRSLKGADYCAYLPLDFTWVVRRFVKRLKPTQFILVESDFWPNLLKTLKKQGTRISLVSGKMSKRSYARFLKFPFFSKKLFSYFDHICVQNEEYADRFRPFFPSVTITGNLKLDLKKEPIVPHWQLSSPVITISCTHAPEEEWILQALLGGAWTLLLAPRHPERFSEVAHFLDRKKIPYSRFSEKPTGKLILIDQMGKLPLCYTHSGLAILGGSFIPGIGGHNVLEPCLYGTPVFFGPYMQTQEEFAKRVLQAHGGKQLPIAALRQEVDQFFKSPKEAALLRRGALLAVEEGRGATRRTVEILQAPS